MRRRVVLAGAVGTAALLTGAGLAWYREKPEPAAYWNLAFTRPDGSKLALNSFQGRPLILNFWATWCPPCIAELPLLERFYQQNTAKKWELLGIAIDQAHSVQRFLERMPLTFPIAIAGLPGLDLSQTLGNPSSGLPFTAALNAKGEVFYRKIGPLTETELQNMLRDII